MKYLRKYENYSDLEKEEQERAKETELSNFPHIQKEKSEKRKKRVEKSYKEDPDGMYPRDSERYDEPKNWQDGMGKPHWLGESNSEFDIDFAITKIKEEYSEDSVTSKFDDEILEWVDSDWKDEYDSEYEWYMDHNNGEAQDVVIDEMIDWYQSEYGKISTDEQIELKKKIQEEYECLFYV